MRYLGATSLRHRLEPEPPPPPVEPMRKLGTQVLPSSATWWSCGDGSLVRPDGTCADGSDPSVLINSWDCYATGWKQKAACDPGECYSPNGTGELPSCHPNPYPWPPAPPPGFVAQGNQWICDASSGYRPNGLIPDHCECDALRGYVADAVGPGCHLAPPPASCPDGQALGPDGTCVKTAQPGPPNPPPIADVPPATPGEKTAAKVWIWGLWLGAIGVFGLALVEGWRLVDAASSSSSRPPRRRGG